MVWAQMSLTPLRLLVLFLRGLLLLALRGTIPDEGHSLLWASNTGFQCMNKSSSLVGGTQAKPEVNSLLGLQPRYLEALEKHLISSFAS